jgi:hypothetical protein
MAIKKEEQKNKLVSVAQNAASNAVTQYKQSAGRLNEAPLPGATQKTAQAAPATAPPEPTTDYSKYKYDAAANDSYMQALSALQAAQKEMPSYAGTYDTQLYDLYNQIVNRDKFKFNLNEDMLYQQYRDRYEQQGALAMRDTAGQAAALTGGYGSTYAEAVGQQQYNAYLQQLNDVVPELYGMALDRYNAEGDRLMQQYGMLGDMADKEYGRYQDALNQYWQNLSYLQGRADTEYDRGYGEWYDAYKMGTEQDQIAYQRFLDQRNYDYQLGRDAVEDNRYNEQFAYQKEQDVLDRKEYADQFAYQKEQDAYDRGFAQQQFEYGKEQDALDREQQAGTTAYEKQLNNYGTLVDLITKTGYTPTDAELAAAGMTRAQANAYRSTFVPKAVKNSSSDGGSGTPTSEEKDEGKRVEEAVKTLSGLQSSNPNKGMSYSDATSFLKNNGMSASGVMSESEWSRQKAGIIRNNPSVLNDKTSEEYKYYGDNYEAYVFEVAAEKVSDKVGISKKALEDYFGK